MKSIVVEGVIAAGKTELVNILAEKLGSTKYLEPVSNNPILPKFYEDQKRWSFPLQVYFLNARFRMLKKALTEKNSLLDRAIYCDSVLAKNVHDNGNMTDEEYSLYLDLLQNMMDETGYLPKKHPDLIIYIKVSNETELDRISKRGRPFEQIETHPDLKNYYSSLQKLYDGWAKSWSLSPILTIDGDKYDFVNNNTDREIVLSNIYDNMNYLGLLTTKEYSDLNNKLNIQLW